MTDEQELIYNVVRDLGPEAYGVPIRRECEARGKKWSIGKCYTLLEQLEAQGFVRSWHDNGADHPERGFRPRRYFETTGCIVYREANLQGVKGCFA